MGVAQNNQAKKEQEYPMATAYAKMWKKERLNQRDKSADSLERPSRAQTPLKNLSNFSCQKTLRHNGKRERVVTEDTGATSSSKPTSRSKQGASRNKRPQSAIGTKHTGISRENTNEKPVKSSQIPAQVFQPVLHRPQIKLSKQDQVRQKRSKSRQKENKPQTTNRSKSPQHLPQEPEQVRPKSTSNKEALKKVSRQSKKQEKENEFIHRRLSSIQMQMDKLIENAVVVATYSKMKDLQSDYHSYLEAGQNDEFNRGTKVDAQVQTVPKALIVVPSDSLFGSACGTRKESQKQLKQPVRPKSSQGCQTEKINPRNSAHSYSNIYQYRDKRAPLGVRKQSTNIDERMILSKSRLDELSQRLYNEGKEIEAKKSLMRLKEWTKDMQRKPAINDISREIIKKKYNR